MSDGFYRALEERHRGSRELIIDRLRAYSPFVEPLREIYSDDNAIDLGCGRGEWLEFLSSKGFNVVGIDLDEGMLEACRIRGLPVRCDDAVAYLQQVPDESQVIVSAFHFVEHISFHQVRAVIEHAFRVLRPGGLMILETPNPENILVATRNFYVDPTHERPLPSELLSFLPEYYGFARTKVLRLQEQKELVENAAPTLYDVLAGASPDYAALAQKGGDAEILRALDSAFDREYGLSLNTLAAQYEASNAAQFHQSTQFARQAESQARKAIRQARDSDERSRAAEASAIAAGNRAELAEASAIAAGNRAELAVARAEAAAEQARQSSLALNAVYQSRSWRITAALRWAGFQARLLRDHGVRARAAALARRVGRPILGWTSRRIESHPELRRPLAAASRRTGIRGLVRRAYAWVKHAEGRVGTSSQGADMPDLQSPFPMSAHAQRVFADLQAAVQKRKSAK